MPYKILIKDTNITITAIPLTGEAFASFGEVIQNPSPNLHPSQFRRQTATRPANAISANQGTAIKYQDVSRMVNRYDQAPSDVPGQAVMNMFVCAARQLTPPSRAASSASANVNDDHVVQNVEGQFQVSILERHPFTTQTFIPLTSSSKARYLVIVAPSLTSQTAIADLPSSPPDLENIKAFITTANQAVTYGAGTWHAPMVALGEESTAVNFVVVQFANGVAEEDCQEVKLEDSSTKRDSVEEEDARSGIWVEIPRAKIEAKL